MDYLRAMEPYGYKGYVEGIRWRISKNIDRVTHADTKRAALKVLAESKKKK